MKQSETDKPLHFETGGSINSTCHKTAYVIDLYVRFSHAYSDVT